MADQTSHGRSATGADLTEEVLERLAEEVKEGLDLSRLRRRPGRPPMGSGPAGTFPVRLDPELREALDLKAASENTTASEIVRAALRRYLKVS
ncbi:MAG: CopG family transcriptional regulator [Acidimicrobiia bacterium]|nr:CopG family transcriptional regulator [Acidimicrobiia bacterium]